MAAETPTPKRSEGENGKQGANANRHRSFRSKRRTRKDGAETASAEQVASSKSEARPAKSAADTSPKEGRERRRRRRSKQRAQTESRPMPAYEDNVSDLPPLQPSFIYTHVIRPSARESYEFRSDHFSKVTRRLEDFNIDLTPLWRAQEEAAKPFKLVLSDDLLAEWAGEEEEEDEAPAETPDASEENTALGADDPEAAIREARRRRRARRAKVKGNRRDRPDSTPPGGDTPFNAD